MTKFSHIFKSSSSISRLIYNFTKKVNNDYLKENNHNDIKIIQRIYYNTPIINNIKKSSSLIKCKSRQLCTKYTIKHNNNNNNNKNK